METIETAQLFNEDGSVAVLFRYKRSKKTAYIAKTAKYSNKYECTVDQELQRTQRNNDVKCARRAIGQPADAAAYQHSERRTDVMAAILKVLRHIKNRTPSIDDDE